MRLIDADALPIVTRGKNHHRKYVFADITDTPTIDAIPVEWLEDKVYDMKRAPLYRRYAEMLLMEWLQEQKEQEAR